MSTGSYWQTTASLPQFESISSDLEVDVVIIGGGLTGITAAYLFKKTGAKVALLERNRCACCDTGHTTAHLTYVTDERLNHLVKKFGKDAAKAFWQAGIAGIDHIHEIVQELKIDCDFKWIPGFLHARLGKTSQKDRKSLLEDAELARELELDAEFVEQVPYSKRAGIRFGAQAKFHPLKYLAGLLQAIPGDGS